MFTNLFATIPHFPKRILGIIRDIKLGNSGNGNGGIINRIADRTITKDDGLTEKALVHQRAKMRTS